MSKIGVGVGEDFPVDDGDKSAGPEDDRAEFEEWKRRRDAYRAERERWRAQREERRTRRDEWRAKRRAFKQKVRDAARESFGPEWEAYRRDRWHHWPFSYGVMKILGIVLVIALISEIFRAPLLILALGIGAWFFFFHRHHRYGYACDYDFDAKPASGPSAKPAEQPKSPEAS